MMVKQIAVIGISILLISGCRSPQPRFRLSAVSSMVRVPFEPDSLIASSGIAQINAAGGEYESFQVVIMPGDSVPLSGVRWKAGALQGNSGQIGKENIQINPVGYVETTTSSEYYPSKQGWWADPLLDQDTLTIAPGERQPLWVTVYVPRKTQAGIYRGRITVIAENVGSQSIPVEVRVWGFDIPLKPGIKTLTWVGSMKRFGKNSPEDRKAMYDLLLKHRLGPGGQIELDEDMLDFCMDRGMNAFILDNIPNLRRMNKDRFPDGYKDSLRNRLNEYVERFGPRGWLDGMAYVYNYDEVDKPHWPLARDMYTLVKKVSPDLRVIQCLNIPEGVKALTGYADTWDVYVAQYLETGVDKRVAAGDEAWLAVCCYPSVRPNFFLEYPAIDGRIIGWICYQTGVTGFEYWSPNHWNGNDRGPELRGGWKANTFSNYSGDGYLTYPGPGVRPLSSIRLENLRDGFEDYEYLKLLQGVGGTVDSIPDVVRGPTEFTSDPALLYRVRTSVAEKIEDLQKKKSVIW